MFLKQPQQERVFSSYLQLDLADVEPCVSGPKRYAVCFIRSLNFLEMDSFYFWFWVIVSSQNRPHDRVSLKEMKADWHACLDSRVGFKVRSKQPTADCTSFYLFPAVLQKCSQMLWLLIYYSYEWACYFHSYPWCGSSPRWFYCYATDITLFMFIRFFK